MPRRSKLFLRLTSEPLPRFFKEQDQKVLKVYEQLRSSIQGSRGDNREGFWVQLTSFVRRLSLSYRWNREKDEELEQVQTEAEEALEKQRAWRKRVERELSAEKKESARLKRELEEKQKRILDLEEKLLSKGNKHGGPDSSSCFSCEFVCEPKQVPHEV